MSKETYYSVKRDLLQCQKRHTTVSNLSLGHGGEGSRVIEGSRVKRSGVIGEAEGVSIERDLLVCQKRPTTVSKETY